MSRRRPLAAVGLALLALAAAAAGARAQQAGGQEFSVTVDSIEVVGNERISDRDVVERTRLQPGTTVRYPDIQEAVHSLFSTGDFEHVEVRVSRGEPAVLYFHVEERPYVFRYEFRGLEHVSPQAVRDTSGLPAEGPLSPASVKRAMNTIKDRLAAKGFPRASVDTALTPMGGDLPGYRLTLEVDEGPRLGLAEIRFEGNEVFSDAQLRRAMSTDEEGFFWFNGGGLRREQYQEDLTQNLPDVYARHGYIDFAVVDDTVMVDPRTGKGIVEIEVEEGPQYRLASFQVEGNSRFPEAEIRSTYSTGAGLEEAAPDSPAPAFDQVGFESAAEQVRKMYRNSGFLRVNVQTDVEKIPRPDTARGPPLVRATWNIDEGEPSYVRTVRIVGNTRTHDRIIRDRLTIVPGDVYSQQRLVNSIQRIQGMGFFERIPPQEAVNIQNREDGDVDITLRVKEKQTGKLNFGMSAAAVSGLAGFVGYEQPNLFGQAKRIKVRWLFGSRTNDINVTYSDPEVLGTDYSVNVNLRRSRDQFRTFSVGTRRQTGGSLELGRPVFDRWTRAFVGYSLFEDKTTDLDLGRSSSGAFLQTGTRSTGSFRLVRDSRNSDLFPTRGSRNMFSLRHTGGVLGGDGDFSKVRLESEWFVPVTQIGGGLQSTPIQFTAGVSFTGGMVVGDNPFFRERFFLGGVQFGEQLRGYEEATVTPRGHVPRNANFSQLSRAGEALFTSTAQFGVRLSSQLYLNTFLDAGNIWSRASAFNPTDLVTGAGIGASLVTPFGPLGIDYAYGFDRRDVLGRPDPGWKLHFKFGRVF